MKPQAHRENKPSPEGNALDRSAAEAPLYESVPFADTQPQTLAALAQLFGLAPPAVAQARVLELGCAGGGNLIPLAVRWPQARFVGIDLSSVHVAQARARIKALGLRNIEVLQGDLAQAQPLQGHFDYIVCHGVYSWVPPAAQAGIFDILNRHLAEAGVAYISYNVLPGWRLRRVVRDLFMRADDARLGPAERVARGRALLAQLAQASDAATPYGQLLRHEVQALATQSDSYVLGEFLAPFNEPMHFAEFAGQAGLAGLAYLCEAQPNASHPQRTRPEVHAAASALSGGDALGYQQQLDQVLGRQFRQSLLVRDTQAPHGQPGPDAQRLNGLCLTADLKPDASPAPDGTVVLREPRGLSITTNDPVVVQALCQLGARFPASVEVAALLAQAPEPARDRLLDALLQALMAGLASVSSVPLRVGRADDARPTAWPLARLEASQGQDWVSNLRHAPVRVDATARLLLQLADGRNSLAALAQRLAERRPELRGLVPARRQALLAQALAHMEKSALLLPG